MIRIEMQLAPEQAEVVWAAMQVALDVGRSPDDASAEAPEQPREIDPSERLDALVSVLRDGTPVPLHVARMLACDCARVEVTSDESGALLDVGRSRRTIPSAVMRALWIRDGGCRVPGCTRKHHLHAHHVEHWAEGGATKLANLALLCPSHPALVHERALIARAGATSPAEDSTGWPAGWTVSWRGMARASSRS